MAAARAAGYNRAMNNPNSLSGVPGEPLLLCQTNPPHPVPAMEEDVELLDGAARVCGYDTPYAEAEGDGTNYNCRIA
jgi:hypothetical protein